MLKYILLILFKDKPVKKENLGLYDKFGVSFKPLVKPNLPKTPTVTNNTASIISKK